MPKPWHRADPALYERVQAETTARYPELAFEVRGELVWLAGPLPLRDARGVEIGRYEIAVRLPRDYPRGAPDLYETGGKIARTADEHMYPSGRACLFVEGERWQHWPEGSTLVDFIDGPVLAYLIGHAHYTLKGSWPQGERSHGAGGILESYGELLGTDDADVIEAYIDVLAANNPKGHWVCPCGSGERLRRCHRDHVNDLREKVRPGDARKAKAQLVLARSIARNRQ